MPGIMRGSKPECSQAPASEPQYFWSCSRTSPSFWFRVATAVAASLRALMMPGAFDPNVAYKALSGTSTGETPAGVLTIAGGAAGAGPAGAGAAAGGAPFASQGKGSPGTGPAPAGGAASAF